MKIKLGFGDPNSVDISGCLAGGEECAGKLLLVQCFAVVGSGLGSEVSTVTSHDFVQDKHARVGRSFTDNIGEEDGTLTGGSVSTEGLTNGDDVIVNGLGHTNDNNLSAVLLQDVLGEMSSLSVGIISTNGVQDVNFVFHQTLSGDFKGGLVVLDEATLLAVSFVGQLDSGVSNGRSTNVVQGFHAFPVAFRDNERVSNQDSLVPINVHAKGQTTNLSILQGLDPKMRQAGDTAGKAGS
mmetsp:Transcript_7419/g.17764  ORF Transcript_7419/g.17764 Transcript_7419/m.17764 type:complete len:239 (-) Transcript_7419:114-830(-)